MVSRLTGHTPPVSNATSLDVPPMSQVMKSGMPMARISWLAAEMPAAGPDSTVRTGCSRTIAPDSNPPFEAMV